MLHLSTLFRVILASFVAPAPVLISRMEKFIDSSYKKLLYKPGYIYIYGKEICNNLTRCKIVTSRYVITRLLHANRATAELYRRPSFIIFSKGGKFESVASIAYR